MNEKPVFAYPLFAGGHKAFFLLAGLFALGLAAVWNAVSRGGLHLSLYYPVDQWHSHELVLGYAAAAASGLLFYFLGKQPGGGVCADRVASLSLLWLYGRLTPFYAGLLPAPLIALVDWLYLPALTALYAKALWRSTDVGGRALPLLLAAFSAANGLWHAELLGWLRLDGLGQKLAVALWAIGGLGWLGRVLPNYTERTLGGAMCLRNPAFEWVNLGLSAAALGAWLVLGAGPWLGALAAAAALSNVGRLAGWFDSRVVYLPLLWVLFSGYLWLSLGFGFLAGGGFAASEFASALATPAFTIGGLGLLSIGLMARLSLSLGGRSLRAPAYLSWAFGLLNVSVLALVCPLPPFWLDAARYIAVYAWLTAFALFVYGFWPLWLASSPSGASYEIPEIREIRPRSGGGRISRRN